MYARVATIAVGSGQADSTADIFEPIVPTLRELDGYRGIVVLDDLGDSRFLVLTLWDSAEALEASEGIARRMVAAESAERDFRVEDIARFRVGTFHLAR
jgi:heme-degrading monooxygenase HmoA